MSRKYTCDRCKEEFTTRCTANVEVPSYTFFGTKLRADLCQPCLGLLRKMFSSFMGSN